MISRTLGSKRAVASIPKGYIPTQVEDVSKVSNQLEQCSLLLLRD